MQKWANSRGEGAVLLSQALRAAGDELVVSRALRSPAALGQQPLPLRANCPARARSCSLPDGRLRSCPSTRPPRWVQEGGVGEAAGAAMHAWRLEMDWAEA